MKVVLFCLLNKTKQAQIMEQVCFKYKIRFNIFF